MLLVLVLVSVHPPLLVSFLSAQKRRRVGVRVGVLEVEHLMVVRYLRDG